MIYNIDDLFSPTKNRQPYHSRLQPADVNLMMCFGNPGETDASYHARLDICSRYMRSV